MENQDRTFGNTAKANHSQAHSNSDLALMMDFVESVFSLTAEHLPSEEHIERRAKGWLKLLTPHFFRAETHYVVQVCSRLRGDRRDAIKADEILRVAEKVYGSPVAVWGVPDAGNPQVWSDKDNDWISLEVALDRLFNATHDVFAEESERLAEFELARPELLKLIYGDE